MAFMKTDAVRTASGFFEVSSWFQEVSGCWKTGASRVDDFGDGERRATRGDLALVLRYSCHRVVVGCCLLNPKC
jgi:hypothetical protein